MQAQRQSTDTALFIVSVCTRCRAADRGFGPRGKYFAPPPPSKGGPAKNLYTKSVRLSYQLQNDLGLV